jgi:pyrroloquinoline quinone (PQQ) biosynthesis protein C
MPFVDELEREVAPNRNRLLGAAFFGALRNGTLTRAQYGRFLVEVFHYSRHTPRLLAAASSKLKFEDQGLFDRFMENAHEEAGHDRWALQDLASLGWNIEQVITSDPLPSTEAMVAFSYYVINYLDPLGLLGSNYALETLGSGAATDVASQLQRTLGIGPESLTFLSGHGEADQDHVIHLKRVTNEFARSPEVQRLVVRAAKTVYHLYRAMMDEVWEAAKISG